MVFFGVRKGIFHRRFAEVRKHQERVEFAFVIGCKKAWAFRDILHSFSFELEEGAKDAPDSTNDWPEQKGRFG